MTTAVAWPTMPLPADKAQARAQAQSWAKNHPDPSNATAVQSLLNSSLAPVRGRWAIYVPARGEAPLAPLTEPEWAAAVAYVRVEADGTMSLRAWDGATAFERDHSGMGAPPASAPMVDDDQVRLVLVPGLAFGPGGQRLGRGRGHYDRMLPRLGNAIRVAVCHEHNLFATVPRDAHDCLMDAVVTHRRLHLTGARPLPSANA